MKETAPLTMKDIARELGISVATVSRALKNSPRISAERRAAIQQYAREHNQRVTCTFNPDSARFKRSKHGRLENCIQYQQQEYRTHRVRHGNARPERNTLPPAATSGDKVAHDN